MEKILITEINRITQLMGVKDKLIYESSLPILQKLKGLTELSDEILALLGKNIDKLVVTDIKKLLQNPNTSDRLKNAILDIITNTVRITPDQFKRMTLSDIKNRLIVDLNMDATVAGLWAKNFAQKNSVDTSDGIFKNLIRIETGSQESETIFNLTRLLSLEEKKIIDDAASKIAKGSIKKLTEVEFLGIKNALEKLQIDLEKAIERYENLQKNLRTTKHTDKINKYKTLIKKIQDWRDVASMVTPRLMTVIKIIDTSIAFGFVSYGVDSFCGSGLGNLNDFCAAYKSMKNGLKNLFSSSTTTQDTPKPNDGDVQNKDGSTKPNKRCPDGSKPTIDYEGTTKVFYCNGVKTNL